MMQQGRVLPRVCQQRLRSIEMASRNASDAQAMIDTADGAHQEVHEYVFENARDCCSSAANGTLEYC